MVAIAQKRGGWIGWIIAGLIVLLIGVVAVAILFAGNNGNSNPKGASASLHEKSSEITAQTASTAEKCAPEFTQVALDRNGSPKVNPNFAAEVAAVEASGVEDPLQAATLASAGHNAQLLAVYANQVDLYEDPKLVAPLVEGNCLSQDGQSLYNQLNGAYHMKGVTFEMGQAPETGINSGVDANGTYGVDAASGVRGDRTAIEITLPNGSKTWIMLRCGNPVFQGHPGLPTVPTDNPPPPAPPTTTTPPPVTPPSDSKNDAVSVTAPQGTTQLPAGIPTTDHVSEDQHTTGEVVGNIIHAPVATDAPNVTTPDIPASVPVTAVGATPNVATPSGPAEVITDDVVHEEVINNDVGGTTGDTEIAVPAD